MFIVTVMVVSTVLVMAFSTALANGENNAGGTQQPKARASAEAENAAALINAIGEVLPVRFEENAADIEAARTAYDALPDTDKAEIPAETLAILTRAETVHGEMESGRQYITNTVQHNGSENARANYYPYETKQDALDYFTLYPFEDGEGGEVGRATGSENSPYLLSLNGTWKFYHVHHPDPDNVWVQNNLSKDGKDYKVGRPWPGNGIEDGFEQPEFDDTGWDDISVPKNWEASWEEDETNPNYRGIKYDPPIYRTSGFSWSQYQSASSPPANGLTNYNPVGTYRRQFDVPQEWSSKSVFLNLDGADDFWIWINGTYIGYSEDTYTQHEFDVSPYLNYGRENTIVVQIIKWGWSDWLQDQDMIRLTGLFRDIYLLAREKVDLFDFEVKTVPKEQEEGYDEENAPWKWNYDGEWELDIKTIIRDFEDTYYGEGTPTANRNNARLKAELYEEGNEDTPVSTWTQSEAMNFGNITQNLAGQDNIRVASYAGARVDFKMNITNPKLWSAEQPNLYKLVLWVGEQYQCVRVGFRHIAWTFDRDDGRMYLNGTRVVYFGTNAHEMGGELGHTTPTSTIRKDFELMKQNNLNAARMSHYPHDKRYYDLADEYGIYIMDEANLETHGNRNLANNAAYGPSIRDRQSNMIEQHKNYPSIVSWSLGNESADGDTFRVWGSDWVYERDPSRPIHWESANAPGQNGQNATDRGNGYEKYAMYSGMYHFPNSWWTSISHTSIKPAVLCEYVHTMGASGGNWDEYTNLFDLPKSLGGFNWDWVDQSILTPSKLVPTIYNGAYDTKNPDVKATTSSGNTYNNEDIPAGLPADHSGKALNGSARFGNRAQYGLTDDFTVDVLVYSTSPTSVNSGHYSIIGKGDNQFMLKETGNTIQWFVYDTAGNWQTCSFSKPADYNNSWNRLTGTYSGNELILYINGDRVADLNWSSDAGIANMAYELGVGTCTQNAGRDYQGYIAEARLLNRVLTAAEISANGQFDFSGQGGDEVFRLGALDEPALVNEEEYNNAKELVDADYWYTGTTNDWDERGTGHSYFAGNGVLFADRTGKPALDEMKMQYRGLLASLDPQAAVTDLANPDNEPWLLKMSSAAVDGYDEAALEGYAVYPEIDAYHVTDNFTIDTYVYSKGYNDSPTIFSNGGDYQYSLRETATQVQFSVYVETADGTGGLRTGSGGTVTATYTKPQDFNNNWHRITATYSNRTLNLYIDGNAQPAATNTVTDSDRNIVNRPYGISVGTQADNTNREYIGYIAGARLLKTALTGAQIAASDFSDDHPDAVFRLVPEAKEGKETYTVRNKLQFSNANMYDMSWTLTENGKVIQEGTDILDIPEAPSGLAYTTSTSRSFEVPYSVPQGGIKKNAEYYFNVEFKLRNAAVWAEKGHVVSTSQMKAFSNEMPEKKLQPVLENKMAVTEDGSTITVTGEEFELVFDKDSNKIASYTMLGKGGQGDKTLIESGPVPEFHRPTTDNDAPSKSVAGWGGDAHNASLRTWRNVGSGANAVSVSMNHSDNAAVITAEGEFPAKTGGSYTMTYTIYADGEVRVDVEYSFGSLENGQRYLAQVGTIFTVPQDLENIVWYGRKGETQVDRKSNPLGIWNLKVAENHAKHLRVQETGNKMDTRWFALTDDSGAGLLVKSGEFEENNVYTKNNVSSVIEFNASQYTQDQLEDIEEQYELTKADAIEVKVNLASRGVGGNNTWGAQPHSQYFMDASDRTFKYNYSFTPVRKFSEADATDFASGKQDYCEHLQLMIDRAEAAGMGDTTYVSDAKDALAEGSEAAASLAYSTLKPRVAAQEVMNMIDDIGEVTPGKLKEVQEIRDAFDALTEEEKSYVTNLNVLQAAEKRAEELIDKDAADQVAALINRIGTVTLNSGPAITAARNAYNALTANQKSLVTNLNVLTAAEKRLTELRADQTAVNNVISLINRIGTVTAKKGPAITAARNAYNALTQTQKSQVTNLSVLTAAEARYKKLTTDTKNRKFTVGHLKYQVLTTAKASKKGTVRVIGFATAKKKKSKASVSIPATVKDKKFNNFNYTVTKIGNKAFSGCAKLKKITIGKNITAIGKQAFDKSKKLKTITIKSAKLKSVGKNALRSIDKKATIKVPKSKRAEYKKLLNKKGQPKGVIIK